MKFRKHKHKFEWHLVYSGAANVTKYGECECGKQTDRELTPAGWQQFGWWRTIFPDWDMQATKNGILYELLPYPMTYYGPNWRLLTREEALAAIEGGRVAT